jgi:hypothetical protein
MKDGKGWSITVGFFVFLFVGFLTLLLTPANSSQVPRPECAEIFILDAWNAPGPDGVMVGQLHALLHETYEFVIDYRQAIPQWPLALLCAFPPDSA